jgi:hypothetical protein
VTIRVRLRGTGEPGATIKLYSDGVLAAQAVVASDGTDTIVTTTALAKGTHVMTVSQTISGGKESATLAAGSLTVEDGVPLVPNPAVLTSSSNAQVTGTGNPNSPIKIYVDAVAAGTGTIGADGTFSITSASALSPGTRAITVSRTVDGVEGSQVSAGSLVVGSMTTAAAVSTITPAQTTTGVCTQVSIGNSRWPLQVYDAWLGSIDTGSPITHDSTGN